MKWNRHTARRNETTGTGPTLTEHVHWLIVNNKALIKYRPASLFCGKLLFYAFLNFFNLITKETHDSIIIKVIEHNVT